MLYTASRFFVEFIQCGNANSSIGSHDLKNLIHYGLGITDWTTADTLEKQIRKQLIPFSKNKDMYGPYVGLQFKRNYTLTYPSRPIPFTPANNCSLDYGSEMLHLPGSTRNRLKPYRAEY